MSKIVDKKSTKKDSKKLTMKQVDEYYMGYNHLNKVDKYLNDAFKKASRNPVPTPGPGQRRNELKEFPLHRDPLFERRFMEERISNWVPDIASVLGVHPNAVAIVTPTKVILGSDDVAIAWAVFGDFLLNQYHRLPDWAVPRLSPWLNRLSDLLRKQGRSFTILKQGN